MERSIGNIAFGVLAGGRSSRMGTDKAALPFYGGRTFLETVLDAGNAFEERIVSLSAEAERSTETALHEAGIQVVRDEISGTGPLEGIRQILLHTEKIACLITATDMPFLTADFLKKLAGLYGGSGNLALTLRGRPEPLCSIYGRACIPEIDALREQSLRRPALLFDRIQTVYVPLEETGFGEAVIRNINDAGEYRTIFKNETGE